MKILIEYLCEENETTVREGVRVSFDEKVVIDEWEGKNLNTDVLLEQMMTLLGHTVELKHAEAYDYFDFCDDCETNFSQYDGDDIIGHRG